MEQRIREIVAQKLNELGAGQVLFAVEWPADRSHGDFAVNAGMTASKVLGKNPREIAQSIVPVLIQELGADVSKVEIAGPGFINITLSQKGIESVLEGARENRDEWGRNNSQIGRRIMIEYANPNPFKEMHIGHLTGAIIGESVSRLFEYTGATILRDTFGGDVGPHVAKALWALRKRGETDIASSKEIGAAYIEGSNAYEESPEAKEQIDTLNGAIYSVVGNIENLENASLEEKELFALWQKGREVSMQEFERIFAILGTKFDYTFFDSDTTEIGMREVRNGLVKGIFEESDGAIIYRGEKVGLHTLVFITSRGNPTYETKDIGLAFLKEIQTQTDEIYIITAVEQIGHFIIMLAALKEIAPSLSEKTKHIPHGLLQLSTGKMGSRKGNIITAAGLIADMEEKLLERNSDPLVASQIALGAIKYMVLRSTAGSNIIFDPEKSLSLEGDSGPYMQYAIVRAKTILSQGVSASNLSKDMPDTPYLLSRLLVRFPDVVAKAQELHAPHVVTQYLMSLAGEFNSFYAQERVRSGEYELHKRDLLETFVITMTSGLWLLGISIPEKM